MGLVSFIFFFFSVVLSLLLGAVSPSGGAVDKSCDAPLPGEHLNSSGLHLTLHHAHGPCSPFSSTSPLPFSEILRHDELRVQSLNSRLTNPKTAKPNKTPLLDSGPWSTSSINVPLNPGQSIGVGNYVTRIGLGTPSKSYAVVVDTGSSLSWVQCQPCKFYCHRQRGPIFNPRASNSYQVSSCKSPECLGLKTATLNPSRCTRRNICIYQASYGDGSFSVGYLSRDTLTLGTGQLSGFVYGCGQNNQGLFGASAGLVGLDKTSLSMVAQLSPKYGFTFSYCLPTSSSTGYLSIGGTSAGRAAYTRMYDSRGLYALKLTSVVVNGRALAASTAGKTIIDSGTVISRIQPALYAALKQAVVRSLAGVPRAPAYSILDTCFKGSARSVRAPAVKLVFRGGAALDLGARNVLIDVDGSTTCLAFASASGVAIIGNTQQQTFRVIYDVGGSRIGFAPGGCS
ncbi:Protein ASPARTIC PROTEASE IN GUARD CELL 1 [Acorus calamus]|uniref:Protein ASPARTIC PROTEASE IN GUARD CELL 1 n=1 Tax=Acorus calamus TaxID=4465 RepID=A0AAV9CWM8_ACOCL|nr:Protein ASPARTIC PROTEASE IN GUARD CELL 1 [Acorus calamus]